MIFKIVKQLDLPIYYISSLMLMCHFVTATEFTFDLIDSTEECFHEIINKDVACILEFQVVSGGQLDVDVTIEGPDQQFIYKELRKEYDRFKFNTTEAGEYTVCFSNQFSTVTDKSVFMSFEAGRKSIFPRGDEDPVETLVEMTSDNIHYYLEDVINGQTHYRLQEATGRRFAKDLNDRVMWWSMMQTFVILTIGVAQVLILRNFFNDPKPEKPITILVNQPLVYG